MTLRKGGGHESGNSGLPASSAEQPGPRFTAAANPAAPVASIGGAWHRHGEEVYPDCPLCLERIRELWKGICILPLWNESLPRRERKHIKKEGVWTKL